MPPEDAGPPFDAGPGRDGGDHCLPDATNIIINEVMVRSVAASGDLGEWFEIFNRSACPVDLVGLVINSPTDAGTNVTHTVTSGVVPPLGFFVLAQSGNSAENHALPHDYVYGDGTAGVVLNNGSDSLVLTYGGNEVDRVMWSFTPPEKRSLQLDPDATSSNNSDLGSPNYCPSASTNVYSSTSGGPYLGTPGDANDDC